jgi:hypothetical protein
MKTIERLKKYLDFKGISMNSFDKSIEASNGYIGKQIKNSASVGSDTLQKIVSVYQDLNLQWLITGVGNMLNENIVNEPSSSYNKMCQKCNEKDLLITDLHKIVDTLTVQITEANKDKELYRNLLASFTQQTINKQAS